MLFGKMCIRNVYMVSIFPYNTLTDKKWEGEGGMEGYIGEKKILDL